MYNYEVLFNGISHKFQTDCWRDISIEQTTYSQLTTKQKKIIDTLSRRFLRTVVDDTIIIIRDFNNYFEYVDLGEF